ncbi:MAG: class I SAM-dependent methyltransferase [Candidatus Sericytochromatia bacterium]
MDQPLRTMLDVSSTMLITLFARAKESSSKDPLIQDKKAEAMIAQIKQAVLGSDNPIHQKILKDQYPAKLGVTMALRSRRFDRYVQAFLNNYPNGTVINLGCGLDTRFDRIDNGQVYWYDLDFPEVIELRRQFMIENARHRFLAGSILDPHWLDAIEKNSPVLILAEGVLMYLKEEEVKSLFSLIHSAFGKAEIVCEVTHRYWVEKMKHPYMQWKLKRQLGMTGGAVFQFGMPDSRYFESWNPDYIFLDEWTYFDDQEKKLGWFNWFSGFKILRKVQWTVHYKLS